MSDQDYDVAVVGGGVVGCAVLYELTRQGYSCILLEKNESIMSEASAGNSGMLHTGFDAPTNSLELECIRVSQEIIHDIVQNFHLPFRKCGAHLIAWKEQQKTGLAQVLQNAEKNGLRHEVGELSITDVYKSEPFLAPGVKGVLHIPNEAVVDSGLLGVCLAHHARLQGAQIYTNSPVVGVSDNTIVTEKGTVRARVVINCAGLHGDTVDNLVGIQSFRIKPRKGQYCVYGHQCNPMLNSIILPTPTEKTKGIAVFKSVYDNVIVGPTAENVPERTRPLFDGNIHAALGTTASQTIPRLSEVTPVGAYTGVRPATQFKDYQIHSYPSKNWITVGGIRSTGVSACFGIAQYVTDKVKTDMCLEPSQGRSRQLDEALEWTLNSDRCSVNITGCRYQMNHPIFQYGQQILTSKI